MPCNSDHLKSTDKERKTQHAAQLLVWLYERTARKAPEWAQKEAADIYASDERCIPQLCAEIKKLAPDQREAIVYDAHDATARQLATWWDAHESVDAARERREAKAARNKAVRRAALAKLTPNERHVLGLRDTDE